MILHILVGDLILENFPKKCKWLKLQLFADDVKEYGIFSDQFFGENIVRFNQTVHIPTDDFESVITKVAFSVNAIKFDGTHIAIGNTSLLCSAIEQATTKSIVLHDKLEAYVGRLTVTVFHNPTPVDLGDEILYKQNTYQPNLKEYGFLLSRRKNRPDQAGSHPISFNHNQERSVNETIAEYKSTEDALRGLQASAKKAKEIEQDPGMHVFTSKLFGKHNYDTPLRRPASAPINHIPKSPPGNKQTHGTTPATSATSAASSKKVKYPAYVLREPPKLRKTIKSVGYVHNRWPEKEEFEHDKWAYKNYLADQRRLALLKEVAEETKFRNQKDEARSIEARARKLRLAQEDLALQSVLETKEEEIKRLRYQLQLMKAAPRPPLPTSSTGRPSSAPATSSRRTPAKSTAAAAVATSSSSVVHPPRSPESKLNRENSLALRLLQKKMSQRGNRQSSERIFSAAKARGESYTPHYASAVKAMTTSNSRSSGGSGKKRRHSAPSAASASQRRHTDSSNRYRTSTGSSELIRSWSNDRKAHSVAAVGTSGSRRVRGHRYSTPSFRNSAGELSRSHILTDIDLNSDTGAGAGGGESALYGMPNSLLNQDDDDDDDDDNFGINAGHVSDSSSASDVYQQISHRSPSKPSTVVKIPSTVHSSGGVHGSFSKAPRSSSDWLANARASVSQLQHGNHLFLHDLHKQHKDHHHLLRRSSGASAGVAGSPDKKTSPSKPLSGSGSKKSKGKSTSPYAIIEKMASKYPNKHFASHPYFSDSDNGSEASTSKPEFDADGVIASAGAASGVITTEEILKRREKELEAREQLLRAEMSDFYRGKNKTQTTSNAVNSSFDSTNSFSSNYLDIKLANAAAAYAASHPGIAAGNSTRAGGTTTNNNNLNSSFSSTGSTNGASAAAAGGGSAGGNNANAGAVPGFLNAFVHNADQYPSYSQAELSLLDRSMDSTASAASGSNTSLLNTANILLNAEKKVKLLPVRSSKESDTFKYNYKIAAGAGAGSGGGGGAGVAAGAGSADGVPGGSSAAAASSSSVDHKVQIAAQFEKNRKFAADGGPVEEINYADLSQQGGRSSELKEKQIISQIEKNRLYQLQQQQQQQQSKPSTATAVTIQVPTAPVRPQPPAALDTSDASLSSSMQRVSLMSPDQLNRKMEEVGQAMGSLEKRIDSFIQNSASKQLLRASAQSTPDAAATGLNNGSKKSVASSVSTTISAARTSVEAVDVSDSDSSDDDNRRLFEQKLAEVSSNSSGEDEGV